MKQKKILDNVYEVSILDATDDELAEISKSRVLGMSLDEMHKLKEHFTLEKRNPTDVELEAFAQSWSEHCCYKSSYSILKDTVFNVKAPQNICVISEDAGVVDFDEDHAYAIKIESHNHPSALDPYGGAATGVGGVLRDVVCMGAQPIALIDSLFFGSLDFKEDKVPAGTKHPRYLLNGVVAGIGDYGNRVGIPTVAGMLYFDDSYLANCLVNVGCVGIVAKKDVIRSRVGGPGDYYVMAGGRTGRDGIHGVTFASAELDEESEESSMPAVQLGYANIKEPLIHACLEINERKLITGMKDFGGGGLSCVASEMAHAAGLGGTIELGKVLLKDSSLSPWEIWVSESQERMMVSVNEENLKKVLEVFDFWDVEAVVVGRVDDSKRIKATYDGLTVLDLDLDFLIAGVCYNRPYKTKSRESKDPRFKMPDVNRTLLKILNSPNVASCESVIRRYDHEVRASTVIKPMQGIVNKQTHGDAAVLKPLAKSFRGLSISSDVNPAYCRLNPYWGAASAVEENIRNLVSVNSRPHSFTDCLNFGNPEKPDRLGDFVEASNGLYFAAKSFGVPFVSGNVSLYNEGVTGPIPPTPTILGVGIVDDVRKTVTSDIKKAGNHVYLIGETMAEFGGSEYYNTLRQKAGSVPRVYPEKTIKKMDSLLAAMSEKQIASCHDLSEGGLAVCAAEMCFGGDRGLELDLKCMDGLRFDFKLFSESNGRWLVEVNKSRADEFERNVDAVHLGFISKNSVFSIVDGNDKLEVELDDLRDAWDSGVGREVE